MKQTRSAYPLIWRIMDAAEAVFATLLPKGAGRLAPYLLLAPAVLLVGTLAAGLLYIGDASLRTLDRTTFLFSDHWSLENYKRAFTESFTWTIIWRSLLGAVLVTCVTLMLALTSLMLVLVVLYMIPSVSLA